jgi:hypothetical protein
LDLGKRILIVGNSGSGKSALADHLAARMGLPAVDLDLLHWENDGYGAKRDEEVAKRLTADAAAAARWIIEGVFGWMARVALPRATALLWLDLPWPQITGTRYIIDGGGDFSSVMTLSLSFYFLFSSSPAHHDRFTS